MSWPVLKQWLFRHPNCAEVGYGAVLLQRLDCSKSKTTGISASNGSATIFMKGQVSDNHTTIWYMLSCINLFQVQHYHSLTEAFKWVPNSLGDNAFAALMNALAKQPLSRLALGYNTLGVQVGVLKQVFWQKTGRLIDHQMHSRHFQQWYDTASKAITCDNIPFVLLLLVTAIVSSLLVKSDV